MTAIDRRFGDAVKATISPRPATARPNSTAALADSVVKPLPFQSRANRDIGVVILADILLFVSMFTGRKRLLDRWEGVVFLALYAAYITALVVQG